MEDLANNSDSHNEANMNDSASYGYGELDTSNCEQKDLNKQSSEAFTFIRDHIKELDKKLKKLENENNELKKENLQKESRFKDLEQKLQNQPENDTQKANSTLQDQLSKLEDENSKLKKDNYHLSKEKSQREQIFLEAKDYYEPRIKELEQKLQKQTEKNTQAQTKEIITTLQNQLSEKEMDIYELKRTNKKLKEEASKYQSALGAATNVRLGNDDQNHSVQLKQDILDLQRTLENYVTHLKPNININIEEVNILIKQYGCRNVITPNNLNKPFIKAVLQRKVLLQIYEFSRDYGQYKGENFSLESDIDSKAQELLNLIKDFSETRDGTDEVSKVATIKIRQQVYGILGNRGFSDIISSQQTPPHDAIHHFSQTLNKMINHYRQINDVERKRDVEKLAPKLIRDVFRIFWFRFSVQEPRLQAKFFESDTKINPDLMSGIWEDDELDKICVDLCYFPYIGTDLDSNYKVITPARVFTRPIHNQVSMDEEENEPNKIVDEKNSSLGSKAFDYVKKKFKSNP